MAVPEEIQKQALAEATSAKPDYSIDYNDERLQAVRNEGQQDVADVTNTYNDMINSSQGFYDDLKNSMQQQADKQAQIQQDNTDFAIEKIEQQKEQAQKDYIKEQSGAYTDWRKMSNQYGVGAEKMASAGLANTGYSESSQVSMYNTYQNRVAMARDSLERAKLNYDNGIKEAMLQNNAALAEIYSNLAIEQAKLALEGFQYKNQLIRELAAEKREIKNTAWQKEMAMLEQMNTENALKWNVHSYYDNKAWQTEENQKERDAQKERDRINNEFAAAQAELTRKHDKDMLAAKTKAEKELLEAQHKKDMEKLAQQQKNALAQIDKQLAADKELYSYQKSVSSTKITGGSSGGSSGSSKTNSSSTSSGSKKTINAKSTVTSTAKNEYKEPTVDMNSVLALGYGPISASRLNDLVKQGVVQEYTEGNKIKYRKVVKKYGFR